MHNFQEHIENYFGPISLEESEQLKKLFKLKAINKGSFFLKENNYCQELAFVESGLLRVFKIQEEKEVTQWIAGPDSFITELSSFLFDTPARWDIQVLEDAKLLSISKTNYQKIQTFIPRWPAMEKMFFAKCFATLESRVFSHLSFSAAERYAHFAQLYPDLIRQVPLQYLASMLGMTPETLSRIRKAAIS